MIIDGGEMSDRLQCRLTVEGCDKTLANGFLNRGQRQSLLGHI